MRGNLGRRTRAHRAAVIISAVVITAAGAAAAGWGSARHPAAGPPPRCGSAVTHFLDNSTQMLSARHGALTCFARAARHCRAASLAVTVMGVDTGTDYVFTIEPGGTLCQVTARSSSYSASFGGSQGPAATATCEVTAASPEGVRLRCGHRSVLIPAAVTTPPAPAG